MTSRPIMNASARKQVLWLCQDCVKTAACKAQESFPTTARSKANPNGLKTRTQFVNNLRSPKLSKKNSVCFFYPSRRFTTFPSESL